jgi:hypothetical protein
MAHAENDLRTGVIYSEALCRVYTSCDHLIRARNHLIQAERPFRYHLLSAEDVDIIKQTLRCNQFTTSIGSVVETEFPMALVCV